jgi:hypothetical protein
MVNTTIIPEDTDLLVIALGWWNTVNTNQHSLLFRSEPSRKSLKEVKCWNIADLHDSLSPVITEHIYFLHASLGSYTTSRIWVFGKHLAVDLIKTNNNFQHAAKVFTK